MEMLPQALRYIRSKGAMVVLATQSLEGLESVLSKAEVADMLSNLQYKVIYDATTPETQEMISQWCGTYWEKHVSWSKSGEQRTQQVTHTESRIVRPQDLLTLAGTGEMILISPRTGYVRLKKAPYYKDPYLKELMDSPSSLGRG